MSWLTAQAPAKLIVSGEHAVVYGRPAIAMAVNRYVRTSISQIDVPSIFFNLKNFKYAKLLTLETLTELKKRLLKDYKNFLEGKCSIKTVLQKPFELMQFTVLNVLEKLSLNLPHGVHIETASTIPIGCGMGSSAASVISVLKVLTRFLKIDLEATNYLNLGKEAENLQHGFSSGLDLHLALNGGSIYYEKGFPQSRILPKLPIFLVYTGTPKSTTGQCVEIVQRQFGNSTIWTEFESLTNSLDQALRANDYLAIKNHIQHNHLLLKEIGVVPDKAQQFISALESRGFAAKICGAGAVSGSAAGVILVMGYGHFSDLVKEYQYRLETIEPDLHGSRIL